MIFGRNSIECQVDKEFATRFFRVVAMRVKQSASKGLKLLDYLPGLVIITITLSMVLLVLQIDRWEGGRHE